MKRIAGLPDAPPSLARFNADPAVRKTWEAFDAYENRAARRELVGELQKRQHGLCAYCEIELRDDDRRIEHFVPRSDPTIGTALTFDHANLMAVCHGGSRPKFDTDGETPDPRRYRRPPKANASCDVAKANRPASAFLDPRSIPPSPSLLAVGADGTLAPNAAACDHHCISVVEVAEHINGLSLNCERLNLARAAVRATLLELGLTTPETHYRAWVESNILPDQEGQLQPFFTTRRSLFGPLAEAILVRPPQAWI